MKEALDIQVKGIVQGVGFRPFVYRLAKKYLVDGWVLNATDGVFIHAEAESKLLDEFVLELSENPPAASRVEEIDLAEVPLEGFDSFEIRFSDAGAVEKTTLVSPDLATCDDCVRELFNPNDRRFSPLPVHQLHELRPALHHHREAALRSQEHVDEGFSHVRALRRRIRRSAGSALPRAAGRMFRVRPAYQLARARKPRRANMHRRANECFT